MTTDAEQIAHWERYDKYRPCDHPVVRFFATQRIDFLRRHVDFADIHSALDVGCGNGFSTYYMHRHVPEIWAVDRSEHMLARHPLRHEGHVSRADALALPFEDRRFDLVYAWELLHHIGEPLCAVQEMVRVSRRYVLLVEPNPLNPAQLAYALLDHEHRWVLRFRAGYLRRLARAAGLRIVFATTGGWVLPNRMPEFLLPVMRRLPYRFFLGISNWVLGARVA